MNAVELVRQICKDRGISIAKLERDCDFSNGYISKLKKGVFPVDKAQKISEYLGLDLNDLIGVQQDVQPSEYYFDNETAQFAQEIFDNPNLRALMCAARSISEEDQKLLTDMAIRFKETNPDG